MKPPKLKGDGRPYVNLDGQAGIFKVSTAEGDPEAINAEGLIFGLDLHNAQEGWLALGKGYRDWQPLEAEDDWGEQPSPDHRDGIEVDLICNDAAFGDQPVRVFSGASLAVTKFYYAVVEAANGFRDDPDLIPTIRVKDIKKTAIGKGHSVTVGFAMAPKDKWMRREDLAAKSEEAVTADDSDDDNWQQ